MLLATVFSIGYIRVKLMLGSFCIFIIPKLQNFSNNVIFLHIPFLFPYRLWYTLYVESFKAVAISIKAGDAYGHLFKIYRKEVAFCQSMKH